MEMAILRPHEILALMGINGFLFTSMVAILLDYIGLSSWKGISYRVKWRYDRYKKQNPLLTDKERFLKTLKKRYPTNKWPYYINEERFKDIEIRIECKDQLYEDDFKGLNKYDISTLIYYCLLIEGEEKPWCLPGETVKEIKLLVDLFVEHINGKSYLSVFNFEKGGRKCQMK